MPHNTSRAETPFALQCGTCGGGMAYNIIEGHYRCPFCGNEESADAAQEKLHAWAAHRRDEVAAAGADAAIMACRTCGAEVQTTADDMTAVCGVCGSPLVRKEIFDTEHFPTAVIPFAITEEEAFQILKKWMEENKGKPAAELLRAHMDELRAPAKGAVRLSGVYLPYRLFQGPFSFTVRRAQGDERAFVGRSFLNHKAVVTSDNLPNDLLDRVEPFDWSGLRAFHFGYLAGLTAQVEKDGYDKTVEDLSCEVHEELDSYVRASMHTPQTALALDLKGVASAPILLPIYYVNLRMSGPSAEGGAPFQVAVNGQTGQVAVYTGIVEKKTPWYIEPILLTALLYFAWLGLISFPTAGTSGAEGTLFELLGIPAVFTAVFALPIFAFYKVRGTPVFLKRFFGTQEQQRRDAKTRRLVVDESAVTAKDDVAYPVFYEKYKGESVPVEYRFMPFRRMASIVTAYLVLLFAPLLLAMLYLALDGDAAKIPQLFERDRLALLMAWEFVALPLALAGWMRGVRAALCSYPYVRPRTGGAWRIVEDAVPVTARISSALGAIKEGGCAQMLFLLFMLLLLLFGPAFAMVYEL